MHVRTGLPLAFGLVLCLAALPAERAEGDPIERTLLTVFEQGEHPLLSAPDFSDITKGAKEYYRGRGFELVWIRDGMPTPQARQAIAALGKAAAYGLNPADYDAELLGRRIAELAGGKLYSQEDMALLDLGLSISFVRFASALHIGRVDPLTLGRDLTIEPKKENLPALLRGMEVSGDLRRSLAELEPEYETYELVKKALARYRNLARDESLEAVPVVKVVRPRERYAGLVELRGLLVAFGDLDPAEEVGTEIYEGALVEAVKRFQRRHALDTDGILGGQTFRALNTPMSRRVRQLALTLERLRWLPHRADRMSLVVNIPAFRLNALDPDGDEPLRLWMKVMVGKSVNKRQTPVFSDMMRYIIFRPYWNVPYSIAARSVIPALEGDPFYLEKNHYEITSSYGDDPGLKTFPPTPENIGRLRSGSLVLRQKPGKHNALGLAKFIFPNSKAIYLHGTPAQQLFSRSRRDFSSGCIRVEDPAALAELLLEKEEGWDRKRVDQAMKGPNPGRVNLSEPVPVFILYATAVVDFEGHVRFFDDIYGHDERLEAVLEAGYPYP